jgi:Icc-related predicted phosphoesterase
MKRRRIVILGDIHDLQERLAASLDLLPEETTDLALLAGDVGIDPPWTSPAREENRAAHDDSMVRTVRHVEQRLGCPVLFVPGNHDLQHPVASLDRYNCDRRAVGIAGINIVGFGGAGPTPFGFPYEWSENEAEAILEGCLSGWEENLDIFLSHSPPVNCTLDVTNRGEHVGSAAVRKWLACVRPKLFICGHIHEAWGVEEVEGVPCLNAGAFGEPYGEEALAWVVEWDEAGPERIVSFRQSETKEWLS